MKWSHSKICHAGFIFAVAVLVHFFKDMGMERDWKKREEIVHYCKFWK